MYIPKSTELLDQTAILDIINSHGFGLMISPTLDVSHLPLIYEPSEGDKGVLYGHMAKANEHWRGLDGEKVLIVFSGPHAYISPTWYASKPAVPTWNYVAVHCFGRVELMDKQCTAESMNKLISKYDPIILGDAEFMPEEYLNRLSEAIVGFRILITDIQAKEKLGQHRKSEDQIGVYQALSNSDSLDAKAMASYMSKRELGLGI